MKLIEKYITLDGTCFDSAQAAENYACSKYQAKLEKLVLRLGEIIRESIAEHTSPTRLVETIDNKAKRFLSMEMHEIKHLAELLDDCFIENNNEIF